MIGRKIMVTKHRKTDEKRCKYSREFKLDAIKLAKESGRKPSDISADLGLHKQMVGKWIKEYEKDQKESFPGVGQPKASEKELYELKRKLKNAEEERDILKKALAIFSKAPI